MKHFIKISTIITLGGLSFALAGCGGDEPEQRDVLAQDTEQQGEGTAAAPPSPAASPQTYVNTGESSPAMAAGEQTGQSREFVTVEDSQDEQRGSERDSQNETASASDDAGRESVTMTLHEEELNVEAREVPAGGVVVAKRVESVPAEESVELRRETIEITRLSPEEAEERQARQQEGAGATEPFDEQEVFIPLAREEAVVDRDVAVREVVQVQTRSETEQQQVEESVRREVIDLEERDRDREVAVADADDQATAESQPEDGQPEQASDASSDRGSLKERVRQELARTVSEEQLQRIEIRVEENTVELAGAVQDESAIERVEERVREIEGVEDVRNNLQVVAS